MKTSNDKSKVIVNPYSNELTKREYHSQLAIQPFILKRSIWHGLYQLLTMRNRLFDELNEDHQDDSN